MATPYAHLDKLVETAPNPQPDYDPELRLCHIAERGLESTFMQRYEQQSENIAWGICGAAMGGHIDFMNRLIELATQFALLDEKTALKWAVYGASQRNLTTLVDQLIERGAMIEDALLGACLRQHTALADTLIARGIASGQLRKNIAIRAVAIGKRDELVKEWLADGASLDQALRGVCCRGANIELAKYLIKQGASPAWIMVGLLEGENARVIEGDSQAFYQLIPDPRSQDVSRVALQAIAEKGCYGHVRIILENCNHHSEALDTAVSAAARGGFRTMVASLIERGAHLGPAIEGAVEGGDRYLIDTLLPVNSHPSGHLNTFFKTAFAMRREDLVQWMLQRLGRCAAYHCANAVKTMENPNEVVQALSMIKNSYQLIDIACKANAAEHIRPLQIAKAAKVSPQIAAASMRMNLESLRYLLKACFLNARSLPREIKFKLFSYVAATKGYQIPERDIPALMRAAKIAEKSWESRIEPFTDQTEMGADVQSSRNCCL